MTGDDWIEHRRGDRELLGWMRPEGDGFVVIDLLGRPRTAPLEWLDAEEFLEDLGIGYLADRYLLRGDGGERPVRIGELSTARVVVVVDDFGQSSAVGARPDRIELPFPVPADLLRPST